MRAAPDTIAAAIAAHTLDESRADEAEALRARADAWLEANEYRTLRTTRFRSAADGRAWSAVCLMDRTRSICAGFGATNREAEIDCFAEADRLGVFGGKDEGQ